MLSVSSAHTKKAWEARYRKWAKKLRKWAMTGTSHREQHFADDGQAVVPLEKHYPDGYVIEPHFHRRHQLLCALTGVVEVATPQGAWIMPPHRGIWIPAGTVHHVRILGRVRMQSLYFKPRRMMDMPLRCQVLGISEFMRVLIAEAMQSHSQPGSRSVALMTLIQHELRRQPHVALSLPFPNHPKLSGRCHAFLRNPNAHETIDEWAATVGMSRRAFTRAFKAETGLSFMEWRQQACLVAVLPRLVAGEAITTVALDLGYDNPGAFTAMFKRILGASPRNYLSSNK